MRWKSEIIERAARNFRTRRRDLEPEYEAFCKQRPWLDDSALFLALRGEEHLGEPWPRWAVGLMDRDDVAISRAKERLHDTMEGWKLPQFFFHRQWLALRQCCKRQGVRMIGDLPIYVARNNVATWTNRSEFQLDQRGMPIAVSGVPADYFNPNGQFWNNPLYRWDQMRRNGYKWWIGRVQNELDYVDAVRLDPFRGFQAYWAIGSDKKRALDGEWIPGPSRDFLTALFQGLGGGDIPIIAEDLGEIDDPVRELVKWSGLPCMRVIQFGFNAEMDNNNTHLRHNHPKNCVVYTGTHDNDTAWGWYAGCGDSVRHHARVYMNSNGIHVNWDMVRQAYASEALTAIVPVQDGLGLGSDSRMNRPGFPYGNWEFRLEEPLTAELGHRLLELVREYGRAA